MSIRSLCPIALSFVVVSLTFCSAYAQPTVLNPSFEDGSYFSSPPQWNRWSGTGSTADNNEKDFGSIDGSGCMAVKGIGSGGKGAYQYISAGWVSGHNYQITAYAKDFGGSDKFIDYSVGWALGFSADGSTATYGSTINPPTTTWQQISVTFLYTGAAGATIFLRANNVGSSERAGFDFVQVVDLNPSPTETPTSGPSPTPTQTPVPVQILKRGDAGGGVQLYFAASDFSKMRDDRGGGATISVSDTQIASSTSGYAPVGTDSSVGFLDNVQCGSDGEVRNTIGWCNSNNRLSPGANLAMTKPDSSGANTAFNLASFVSQISGPDPRNSFVEQSVNYQAWVLYSVSSADLLNATKVYLWFRAFKPVIQSDGGEGTDGDDSNWIVGSPEHSVTDRNLYYLADDGDGPGDNDGPDKSGTQPQLFNNSGFSDLGIGQWMWGNTRLETNSDLNSNWCATPNNKLTSEGNRVTVLYTTLPNDGNGKGTVRFYIVGREAETLDEAIKMDVVCISTVGPALFVPSDDSWQAASALAPPAQVKPWRELR